MRRSPFNGLLWVSLLWMVHALSGQQRTIASSSVPANLREVTAQAATILVGRVVSIKPISLGPPDEVGCVEITFQVEQGIRGARAGQHFSFREWVGLWSEADRYRVGQRMMLFLYTPSTLGLTSPVGGPAGRLPVDESGRVRLTPAQLQSIRILQNPHTGVPRIPVRDLVRAIRGISEE